MKKAILLIIAVLILTNIAAAYETCEDTKEINGNCTMITPVLIGCSSYDYDVYNSTNGAAVQNGALTSLTGDIYQFNFTQGAGDYVVKLCDGTTREIKVKQEDDMIIFGLMLLPIILSILFIVGAATLDKEKHAALKIFLFLFSILPVFASFHLGLIGIAEFYNIPEIEEWTGYTIYYIGSIFVLLVTYFLIYLIYTVFNKAAQAKEDARLEY